VTAARLPLLAWDAPLYCHAPVDDPFDPGAIASAGDRSDRWCQEGEPTAYLASDAGVALAELARHHPPGGERAERRIMRLEPRPRGISGLVDLRDRSVLLALDAPPDPAAWLDRGLAAAVARRIRADDRQRGLIVPSMAFLDRPDRANVVLFAERFEPGGLGQAIATWNEVARIAVGGA
jgi:hypothetical protein